MIIIACFNSRTRVGATILCPRLSSPNRCFNSRTRVGATGFQGFLHILVPVSIHAPVWVRRSSVVISDVVNGFQFTHPCGCDAYVRAAGVRVVGFNSRTRVGATEECNAPRHLIELRQVSYITCLSANSVQGVCIDSASPLQATSRSPQSTASSSSLAIPSWSILSLASASRCITLARSLAG